MNSPRLLQRGRYKYFVKYDVCIFFYDNNNVNKAYYIWGVILSGIVLIMTLFLNICNLRKLTNKSNKRIRNLSGRADLHLAIYTAILTIGLIWLNVYYTIRSIGVFLNNNFIYQSMLPHFGWILDIIVFGSVWSLFLISTKIRRSYIKFYKNLLHL
uniref:Serpentine receptor class gamma n=1 Tax=Strongyloides venezuelensis TaxID=75913 RepID=A0A0K0FMI8_STRVS